MKHILSSALVLALSMSAQAVAQTPPSGCLHQVPEARPERIRREEALQATRMINTAVTKGRVLDRYPSWTALAGSPVVAAMRTDGGPMGQLARKIVWGSLEPLPGWNMHFVAAEDAYAFTLRDTRDPCGFSYMSDESGVVWEGQPIGPRVGIVPVAPTQ